MQCNDYNSFREIAQEAAANILASLEEHMRNTRRRGRDFLLEKYPHKKRLMIQIKLPTHKVPWIE